MATWYPLIKTLHLVFAIAFMSCVFYLPRILVNIAEVGDAAEVRARLILMGKRLMRFGHMMFGVMLIFGLVLWLGFKIQGGWLHAKVLIVAVLFAYYIWIGRMLKSADAGQRLASSKQLRWINEIPVLLLLVVVWLVIAKPF
ncbi:CopD family protein [Lysobacter sp. HDW10]|uniref:CopD family protein n=1 Tax=Lysobacter sp. HDW10 TaxID=2714936 RepID=UPI00140E3A81|nr:CopD family protein [Lysobacter sp. HDW10]QIK81387.1 CopD family protein [Lysobacter sp. HDW10]